ncbi:MAG: hypothetical protein ACLFR0_03880 [Alphaproteobacteria bacterium]
MAIDNFGPPNITPEEQKAWDELRTRAFFKAAAGKLDTLGESNILDAYEGNINAAVDALDIDAEFGEAVKLEMEKMAEPKGLEL